MQDIIYVGIQQKRFDLLVISSPFGSPVNLEIDFGDGNRVSLQNIERSRRKDDGVVAAFNEDITINHTYATAGNTLYFYLMLSYRLQNIFL